MLCVPHDPFPGFLNQAALLTVEDAVLSPPFKNSSTSLVHCCMWNQWRTRYYSVPSTQNVLSAAWSAATRGLLRSSLKSYRRDDQATPCTEHFQYSGFLKIYMITITEP